MKRFMFEVVNDGEKVSFNSENSGFNAMELVGMLTLKIDDIKEQCFGEIKPDVVTRTIIKEQDNAE